MNMQSKRIVTLLSLALLLSACGAPAAPSSNAAASSSVPASSAASSAVSSETSSTSTEAATRTFTDSLGREVQIPAELTAISPSGTLAQMMLFSLVPDRMVGLSSKPTKLMEKYYGENYVKLLVFGTFYGKSADLNREALIAAAPQLVIDMGEIKGDPATMKADLDALQTQIGVPVAFIEARLNTSGDAYRMLGELVGAPDTAAKLADYCDATIAQTTETISRIPEEKRPRVYYGEGENGLKAVAKGSFHGEVLELVGAVNIADIPIASGGGSDVSMEQLLLWQPDAILFSAEGAFQTVGTDPLWKDLTAVQQKRFYEIPDGPHSWMGRPPAVNRILGIKWLENLLYPGEFAHDMIAEAQEFYKLFYHYDLSADEAKALMENSTFMAQ